MKQVLEGIRVIDWTQWHAGPYATALLGDLGAEVLHIEDPARGDAFRAVKSILGASFELPDGRHAAVEELNRNKRGVALNLKHPRGLEAMLRLVERSDVFVTNFRGADRLGLGYEGLKKINPRLIYATNTGYGPRGPDAGSPSLELMAYARSGAMLASGEPGMPPIYLTASIADRISAVFLSYGILCALLARERFGVGQEITSSQLSAMIVLQGTAVIPFLLAGREMNRHDRSRAGEPLYNWYCCRDGRWLALGMLEGDRYWSTVCRALGREDLEKDPRFAAQPSRGENSEELVRILDQVFATRTREEWLATLRQAGDLIVTVVNKIADLPSDPQVTANNYIVDWDHPALGPVKFVPFPVELSETPASLRLAAPQIGEHTEQVLTEVCGYSRDEVAELRQQGAF